MARYVADPVTQRVGRPVRQHPGRVPAGVDRLAGMKGWSVQARTSASGPGGSTRSSRLLTSEIRSHHLHPIRSLTDPLAREPLLLQHVARNCLAGDAAGQFQEVLVEVDATFVSDAEPFERW